MLTGSPVKVATIRPTWRVEIQRKQACRIRIGTSSARRWNFSSPVGRKFWPRVRAIRSRIVPSLTFSREGPAVLIVEQLGHKVAEKWQRRHQSGQGRRTTPRDDAE